ncbi:MAG: DUF3866 family protein [Firmicutes bacterium]|nr:DUF3866 family protein [Bacillota bacterium]
MGLEEVKALNYPSLTGNCRPGDEVLVNTTAQELKLGTGGWHYVLAVQGREHSLSLNRGHIMKLRYTPLQGRVFSVEEERSPYHRVMADARSLAGLPVAVGSLHSMLAPIAFGLKTNLPALRLAYLMSDGAALPLAFSDTVRELQALGLIDKTITFGHAFGGDLEAINIYSALLAAKHVAQADVVIVLMGPGVVGTKTKWGTTAIEQGQFLNAALHLEGTAVCIPRCSEGDPRSRHQGWSHHTLTVLENIVQNPVRLGLPLYLRSFPPAAAKAKQLPHKISWHDTELIFQKLSHSGLRLSTMGRDPGRDPLFFHGVLAAALETLACIGI